MDPNNGPKFRRGKTSVRIGLTLLTLIGGSSNIDKMTYQFYLKLLMTLLDDDTEDQPTDKQPDNQPEPDNISPDNERVESEYEYIDQNIISYEESR